MLKRLAIALLCLGLAGCGSYRPLYGTGPDGASVATYMAEIGVPEQRTRAGQILRNELLSGRGAAARERFALKLEVTEKTFDLSSPSSSTASRKRYNLLAHYTLTDNASGKVITSGESFSNVSYDVVNQPVSDLSAADNARIRAAKELGQDIKLRLAAFISAERG